MMLWFSLQPLCSGCERPKEIGQHGKCVVCRRKATKLWKLENPERAKQHLRLYRIRHPEKERQKCARYAIKHREKILERKHQFYKKHSERLRKESSQWRQSNPDKVKLQKFRYKIRHPEILKLRKKRSEHYCTLKITSAYINRLIRQDKRNGKPEMSFNLKKQLVTQHRTKSQLKLMAAYSLIKL